VTRKVTLSPASAIVTSQHLDAAHCRLEFFNSIVRAILNIQVGLSSDKLVSTYQTRRCHISEHHNMNQRLICKRDSYRKSTTCDKVFLISNIRHVLNVVLFIWVIPRPPNFMCRRFGALFSIFIGGVSTTTYEDETQCSETSAHKIQMPGINPKERIQHN